jgi:type IV secretory pathway TrbL component
MVREGRAPAGFLWVSVGGALIGLGGIALAFLKSGNQFLFFSEEVVFTILAPLLLLMALAFTWGFMKEMKSEEEGGAIPTA